MIFNTITIDGNEIYAPNDFTLAREDVYSGEYVTCTGKTIADVIGWKYSDMTLSWDTLPDAMMTVLTGLSGEVNMTFSDTDGTQTETIIRKGFTDVPTRFTNDNGDVIWSNVQLQISFINTHI